ncbi:MAG: redoxin domain-containing protein [Anaerolineales bacterium]|jgi:peroxiredoxin
MDNKSLLITNQTAPDFSLPDLEGDPHALHDYNGRIVILNFWSAECPWSQRSDEKINEYLEDWGSEVQYLPIASNANEDLELIRTQAASRQIPLILHDPDHQVADLYGADTTPHLFVIDQAGILRYQGALDDVKFRQPKPTLNYLHLAVEALLTGASPDPAETPAYGCTIVRNLP